MRNEFKMTIKAIQHDGIHIPMHGNQYALYAETKCHNILTIDIYRSPLSVHLSPFLRNNETIIFELSDNNVFRIRTNATLIAIIEKIQAIHYKNRTLTIYFKGAHIDVQFRGD